MNLNLTDLLLEETDSIDVEVRMDLDTLTYSFGTFPIREKNPVKLTIVREDEVLHIHGRTLLKVTIPCDRCLEDVNVPFDLDFDEYLRKSSGSQENGTASEEEFDAEIGEMGMEDSRESAFDADYYVQGYNLDVDKLISGEALLIWPSRVLCREDCKGLCPVCGRNLNLSECGCDRTRLDPRMAKVLDVFSNYQQV